MARTAVSFSMNASTTILPPQRAHFSTSAPWTRLSAAAQSRRYGDGDGRTRGACAGASSVTPSAGGFGTTSDRNFEFGASTP